MDEGVQILELARNAQRLFERQEPRQKRRLLNFVLSNCFWEDGEVRATFRQPFDLLAETTTVVARQKAGNTANSAKRESWLCCQSDANLSPTANSLLTGKLTGNFHDSGRPRALFYQNRRHFAALWRGTH
jgi:hypothetical protein